MTKLRFDAPQDLGNVLAASDSSKSEADALRWFDAGGPEGLALAIRKGQTARESDFALGTRWLSARVADGGASRAEASERPASGEQSSPTRAGIGSERPADASASSGSASAAAVTIANGATLEIDGPSAQSVTFEGTTGTLKLQDAVLFTGLVSGLTGDDAIDLSGFAYGSNIKATYLGNADGGALTVTDGAKTARIALSGNYLSSTWTLSSDGKGGATVVDPTTSANWQTLKIGGGGYADGLDIAPDGSMVVRTDGAGAYLWNGTSWVQLGHRDEFARRICRCKLFGQF